jgi:myo-inositol-1(or 4)-monophosphatase
VLATVDSESKALLVTAVSAAAAGGQVILSALGSQAVTRTKGAGDYVTEVDRASEAEIRRVLEEQAPGIPVFGEEGGGDRGVRYWAVDPLDGTTNYLHGFPIVGVSIALVEHGTPVVGVVYAPLLQETYVAADGRAEMWVPDDPGIPVQASDRPPERAIVGTGFPFRNKELVPRYLAMFERCFERFEDLRRPGAAAMDLAWVAAGVFDGFFELNLSTWDVAAGAALVRAAGGVVTDWEGDPDRWLDTGNILAGNPEVHAALLEIAGNT